MPSPPLHLTSEREMSACQVDVRLDSSQAGQTSGQPVGGYREMAQGGSASDQELGIKLLMTSKVGLFKLFILFTKCTPGYITAA